MNRVLWPRTKVHKSVNRISLERNQARNRSKSFASPLRDDRSSNFPRFPGSDAFNRAMLMNVGYVEALKERPFDCFIFHDVDLLPEDDRNLYTCPEQPRHMSVAVDKFKYRYRANIEPDTLLQLYISTLVSFVTRVVVVLCRLPYADLFGGVSAMSCEQFHLVNGFSNVFWGWGGEDDDMANRIKAHGLHISRYPANVARYKMLTHKKEKANPKR